MLAFFFLLILLVSIWVMYTYNGLIKQIESVRNNQTQIDIQLDRRFKVFQSLINVVKKYMDYEQTTLKEVVALRNQAQEAQKSGNMQGRVEAENGISRIASNLNLVFEQYPQLKADTNALQFQEEIVNTENKLAYSKQAFNDSIERYNATKKSFLQAWIVNFFRAKLDQNFIYWSLSAEKTAEQENFIATL